MLAVGALCLADPRASAQCDLNFTVNPQLSTLSLGGGLVAPLAAPLIPVDADIGLQGAAAGTAPGACPQTAEALAQQLQGWRLGTTAQLGPLQLYPASVQVRTEDRVAVCCCCPPARHHAPTRSMCPLLW